MKMQENIGKILLKRAERNPDREILVFGEDRFTFSQLNERTNQLAHALKRMGIEKATRIAVLLTNGNEMCEILFAIAKIGAVMVPLNVRLAARELEYIIGDCGAEILIFEDKFFTTIEKIRSGLAINTLISVGKLVPSYATGYNHLIQGSGSFYPKTSSLIHQVDLFSRKAMS